MRVAVAMIILALVPRVASGPAWAATPEANAQAGQGVSQEQQAIADLKDSSSHVRQQAAFRLGTSSDRSAVEPLIGALSDPDWLVQFYAVIGLGKLGDPRAIDPLLAALKDQNSTIREAVSRVLCDDFRLTAVPIDSVLALLQDTWGNVRYNAIRWLQMLEDPRAVRPLLTIAAGADQRLRWAANDALKAIARTPTGADVLYLALQDPDPHLRRGSAEALGRIKGARTAASLVATTLNDADLSVREEAADSLRLLGDAGAADALIIALADRDPAVRARAARALGESCPPQAVAPLRAATKDTDESVRVEAGFALGLVLVKLNTSEKEAFDLLRPGLTDQRMDGFIKRRIVGAFITSRSPQAVAVLAPVLPRVDATLIAQFYEYFIKLGAPNSEEALIRAFDVMGPARPDEGFIPVNSDKLEMANTYLNCGNQVLADYVKEWASARGYDIKSIKRYALPTIWGAR